MKMKEIAELIERFAPASLAYGWDNVGLLAGSPEKEVGRVLTALDTNLSTVYEAIENKCDAIISHHPVFFGGIKRIDYSSNDGRLAELLIKNDIAVYAAHTNMDTAEHGINAVLAKIFGLSDVKILEYHTESTNVGLGRYGILNTPVTFGDLCNITKEKLHTPCVRAAGDFEKNIKTLCVASGSCSESIETALRKGCDAVITGDMKYHEMIDYFEKGLCVLDAGHYPTEVIVTDIFADILKNADLEIIKSKQKDIFNFV